MLNSITDPTLGIARSPSLKTFAGLYKNGNKIGNFGSIPIFDNPGSSNNPAHTHPPDVAQMETCHFDEKKKRTDDFQRVPPGSILPTAAREAVLLRMVEADLSDEESGEIAGVEVERCKSKQVDNCIDAPLCR